MQGIIGKVAPEMKKGFPIALIVLVCVVVVGFAFVTLAPMCFNYVSPWIAGEPTNIPKATSSKADMILLDNTFTWSSPFHHYANGYVMNVGPDAIQSYAIIVEYMDKNGNVLDSVAEKDKGPIMSWSRQSFSIKHKRVPGCDHMQVVVQWMASPWGQ